MSKGKYLAVDYGDRRVGLAVSDFDKQVAFPREVIGYRSEKELIGKIVSFCADESVSKVIVGLPIEMDGTPGERFRATHTFGDRLKEALGGIPVEYFDERLTTRQSVKKLHEQGIQAKEQKGVRDMIAAQIILESYLKASQESR